MPFVAECILCRQKVRLPDHATGASVCCPRCGNYFTAAAEHSRAAAARYGDPAPIHLPAPGSQAAVSVADESDDVDAADDAEVAATPPSPVPAPTHSPAIVVLPTMPRRRRRRGVDPLGLVSLLVAAAALGCAASFALGQLVVPLAAGGLVLGLIGVLAAFMSDRPRYLMATTSCLANVAIVIVGVFFPVLLGPAYQLAHASTEPDVIVPRAVPLAGKPSLAPDEDPPEWPDATRFAMKVKHRRFEVFAVALRPIETGTRPRKLTKENYLVVRIRIYQPAVGADFAGDGWREPGTSVGHPEATLTDTAGRAYAAMAPEAAGEVGERTQRSSYFPIGVTDETYVFEAPTPGAQSLRLEMSATPWGGTGSIRFTIPRSMFEKPADKGSNAS
jgi:hypothetical protein